MDNEYYLNADEIKTFDNINADREASKRTLQIALIHHDNRMSELSLLESAVWDSLIAKMGISRDEMDDKKITLHVVKKNGGMVASVKSFIDKTED